MLSERQLFILQVLIDDYIQHVEPIGSRTLSKREDMNFSSATIRNELADLEDLGFLEKTHTSSGRIPSEKGYRFYVDHLLSPAALSTTELFSIQNLFHEKLEETERIFDQSARILSELTNYTSIILGPEALETTLKHLQLIPLGGQQAVAIFVTSTGHVENRHVMLPESIQPKEIETLVNILNEKLSGVPLAELHRKMDEELALVFQKHLMDHQQATLFLADLFTWGRKDKVFFGGKTKMLYQPEFKDVEKVRILLDALEEKAIVERLLTSDRDGVSVTIGHENGIPAIKDCSLIKASYSFHDKHIGTISLIGPTRMEYKRVIGLLDTLSKQLTQLFNERY
ncbi:heat-inducible transcription repressor [Fictibacillus macauensis ZFHKF-1]|uniref:Heat-inducible transcription repressor HrcA n=1 Tax=Fictibacillus macauensis ZFHKF-1 TaxID=1196324 RepID=I8UE95_9BACL|nr:heat-inducible transcriptional repressor HrcA [Fictibacillus macauensis]EIT85230.1 heat-inducible transcription repressor [Fictibacillus macauensis ZFHKF-1]